MKKFLIAIIALLALCVTVWIVYIMFLNINNPLTSYSMGTTTVKPFTEFPLGLETRTKQSVGGGNITLICRVSAVSDNDYLYYYRIEYNGETPCLYRWDILEKTFGKEVILDLKTISSPKADGPPFHEFKIICSAPPIFAMGQTKILQQKQVNDENLTATIWIEEESMPQIGPIPDNFRKLIEQNVEQGVK